MTRAGVFAAALVTRLVVAFLTFGSVDLIANMRDSARVLTGALADTPYLPFNELWLWIAAHLAFHTALPVAFVYKLLPSVFDALIALLLVDATKDRRAAWLYAFAPVPIVIMAVHGQWDSQWLYFVLLALVLVRIESPIGPAAAGAAIVLAVAAKPVAAPLALLLLPLNWRRFAAYAAGGVAMLLVYLAVLWATGSLLSFSQLLGIVRYVQGGVVLFGLPNVPVPRLVSLPITTIALWLLIARRVLTREEAVLLFTAAALGLSGLAPQYLCWVIPFALLCGRWGFAAIYSLIVGLFLLIYYQLPVLNGFNIENMGAWGFLNPLGRWSPALPDPLWRTLARAAGNYLIPLLGLGYVGHELIHVLRKRSQLPAQDAPPQLRVAIPLAVVIAAVLALFAWTTTRTKPEELAFAYKIEQKAAAYDVVRYRGPIPPEKRRMKIWIARSYTAPGVSNDLLNINTIGALWIVAWSAAAALLLRKHPAVDAGESVAQGDAG